MRFCKVKNEYIHVNLSDALTGYRGDKMIHIFSSKDRVSNRLYFLSKNEKSSQNSDL